MDAAAVAAAALETEIEARSTVAVGSGLGLQVNNRPNLVASRSIIHGKLKAACAPSRGDSPDKELERRQGTIAAPRRKISDGTRTNPAPRFNPVAIKPSLQTRLSIAHVLHQNP
jgi:hypothetical protein